MNLHPVKSSQIKEVGYDQVNSTIHILFKYKNKMFLYYPFTLDQYTEFLNSESIGKYFHKNIRKHVVIEDEVKTCHRCEEEYYEELMHPASVDEMWFCNTCNQVLSN